MPNLNPFRTPGYVSIQPGFNISAQRPGTVAFAKRMVADGPFRRVCVIVDTAIDQGEFVQRVTELQALGFEVTGVSVAGQSAGSADEKVRQEFIQAKLRELAYCAEAGITAHGGPWLWPWLNMEQEPDIAAYEARALESLSAIASEMGSAHPVTNITLEAVSAHETPYFSKAADMARVVGVLRKTSSKVWRQLVDICHMRTAAEVGELDLGQIEVWLAPAIADDAVGLVHISAAHHRGHPLFTNQPNEAFVKLLAKLGYSRGVDVEIFLPTGPLDKLLNLHAFTIKGIDARNVATFANLTNSAAVKAAGVIPFLKAFAKAHIETASACAGWWDAQTN